MPALVLTPIIERFTFQPPDGGPVIIETDSTDFVYIDNPDGSPASVDLPQFPGSRNPRRPIFVRAAGEAVLAGEGPLGKAAAQAELAAARANSIALFDVTFSVQLTAGDDLSAVTWQWTAAWASWGGFVFPAQSLPSTDGSSIDFAGYIDGNFVIRSSRPRWQQWGGIGPGSAWTEELRIVLSQPASANATIACTGCPHGAITRSISAAPRFGLRSQALDG